LVAGVQPDNAQMTVLLDGAFSSLNIRGGKWQGARIEALVAHIEHPEYGPARRHVGYLGEVPLEGVQATPEFRGLMQLLAQEIGDLTSKRCRYQLGDEDCGVDVSLFTYPGVVGAVTHNQEFEVALQVPGGGAGFAPADGWFYKGRIIFDSGVNAGLEMETMQNVGSLLTLFMPMRGLVAPGNTVRVIAGDDKTIETCVGKFDNGINNGSEWQMPNREDVFTIPEEPNA
jgi:uncharacterized phage protein (TIGR02218 family)